MPTLADAQKWFLQFSSKPTAFGITAGNGRPWGDGTSMALREGAGVNPWDESCIVTPLIGGYEALNAMREDLELAIGQAPGLGANQRRHVYIAGWRFDPLRDLSEVNAWTTGPWKLSDTANIDQTAAGLILRMMQAEIQVRILLFYPTTVARAAGLGGHIDGHLYLAELVEAECKRLSKPARGIVALDLRTADPQTAAHHQKTIIIRVGTVNVAYCGGVDWALTRRDAVDATHPYTANRPEFLGGDWQSGDFDAASSRGMPTFLNDAADRTHQWPKDSGVNYTSVNGIGVYGRPPTDLPATVYGKNNHVWHDQHLRLQGPIVRTLEEQFRERWRDAAASVNTLGTLTGSHITDDQVIFSTSNAIVADDIAELAFAAPVPSAGGTSFVQMWRTIPLRPRARLPFQRGEFTVMAGISNACRKASELIWIFDQYFFSRPLARLLNHLVKNDSNQRLCVIVVLPPYADTQHLDQHRARKLALEDLTNGLATGTPGQFNRVAVYNLWDHTANRGIYCHAKVQTYDRDLLVCGSANLNRRSFTCDTELNCAVLDSAVVDAHQRRLWSILFPATPWPNAIAFNQAGWGKNFLNAFKAAATAGSYLEQDKWWNTTATITSETETIEIAGSPVQRQIAKVDVTPPQLPNGVAREQDYPVDYLAKARTQLNLPGLTVVDVRLEGQQEAPSEVLDMEALLEPSSLTLTVENGICVGNAKDPAAKGRLDEIVFLIEGCVDKKAGFPWRKVP